jgi:hypothetical protein
MTLDASRPCAFAYLRNFVCDADKICEGGLSGDTMS